MPSSKLLSAKPVELAALAESARGYVRDARAPSTRAAYARDWQDWVTWAGSRGFVALPAEGEAVALYLAELADLGRAPATLARRLAAISQAHGLRGALSPRGAAVVREVVKGIRRRLAASGWRPEGKAALVLEDVRRVAEAIPNWAIGLRDRAIIVFGFAGAFRRSELAELAIADLVKTPKGWEVTIRRSKTDQEGKGRKLGIPFGSNPLTCPVRTVEAWRAAADLAEGQLFRSVTVHGHIGESLSAPAIAAIVKHRVAAVGLDPALFAGHSLRAGFCTTAARAGKNPKAIAAQTGHRTLEMVLRYVRDAALFEDNAAMGIGL